MKVAAHSPHTWFLLNDSGSYFFDARVSRSGAEWSVLIELSAEERREYHAIGRLYLDYLQARIHNFVEEYQARDISADLGERATSAIQAWRSSL